MGSMDGHERSVIRTGLIDGCWYRRPTRTPCNAGTRTVDAMSGLRTRHLTRTSKLALVLLAATPVAVLGQLALRSRPAGAAGIGQLRSQLDANSAHENSLGASLAGLDRRIGVLTAQIALVDTREASVRATLAADTHRLGLVLAALAHERRRAAQLRRRLARARRILGAQLVSRYEEAPPNLVSVVVDARGFNQLRPTGSVSSGTPSTCSRRRSRRRRRRSWRQPPRPSGSRGWRTPRRASRTRSRSRRGRWPG